MFANITRNWTKSAYLKLIILGISLTLVYLIATTPETDLNNRRKVIILSWHEDSDNFGYTWLSEKSIVNGSGLHRDCVFTKDRTLYDQANALIFNWMNVDTNDLPPTRDRRPDNQIWILFSGESPCYTRVSVLEALQDQINYTSSYRLDDDIPSPFGRFSKLELTSRTEERVSDSSVKNGKAAWLVSHCYTESKREYYVKRLNESFLVDQFGVCNRKLVGNCAPSMGNIFDCYHQLKNYTFYLSFENSICKDYGTEKLFFAYHVGLIPVIFGGYDTKLLPENSYINAMDYENPDNLANYLKFLSSHPEELKKFGEWRQTHQLRLSDNPAMVTVRRVCDHLRKWKTIEKKPVKNLIWWWYFGNPCFKWNRDRNEFVRADVARYEKSEYDDMVARHGGHVIDDL